MEKKIHKIDASGKVLGRLATQIAVLLRGKGKVNFLRYIDSGDFVEVVNAQNIKVTGKKMTQKIYYTHSLYPGGLKAQKLEVKFAKNPGLVLRQAVYGMLPKNKTRNKIIKRLKILKGE
ncbi:MAG: 50S ribosomal protein L13 [Candidatus Portnoybacteria bacterium RBG_13_41_18]|uniref:Large ribosomal subunit protein uL13 n=1 Tax=Candidatus Portnoybacteria bacterium RBG_13_41_18 TaxID=1801991 RepID=A0A1G2F6F0_9BACT|nr:MAG: 50S ribosomal protein L13 [Candidatus Portnoybacteria bacterium RBG_13_41_18]